MLLFLSVRSPGGEPPATIQSKVQGDGLGAEQERTNWVGATGDEITRTMGKPANTYELQGGQTGWTYYYHPPRPTTNELKSIIGVEFLFKSGKVVQQLPIFCVERPMPQYWPTNWQTLKPERQPSPPSPAPEGQSGGIRFYVVSESRFINGSLGSFFDTPEFPKLGFVRKKPDLELRQLLSAESAIDERGAGDPSAPCSAMKMVLTQPDAERWKALTADNVGKQVLFVAGETPVCAPRIDYEIPDGRLIVDGLNSNQFSLLKTEVIKILSLPSVK
jgi:hypothetical protein